MMIGWREQRVDDPVRGIDDPLRVERGDEEQVAVELLDLGLHRPGRGEDLEPALLVAGGPRLPAARRVHSPVDQDDGVGRAAPA